MSHDVTESRRTDVIGLRTHYTGGNMRSRFVSVGVAITAVFITIGRARKDAHSAESKFQLPKVCQPSFQVASEREGVRG